MMVRLVPCGVRECKQAVLDRYVTKKKRRRKEGRKEGRAIV
jgi:hypothetical protein